MADIRNMPDLESGRLGSSENVPGQKMQTVTLTSKQFEKLYLQPKEPGKDYSLERSFGNPTPLYSRSFLTRKYLANQPQRCLIVPSGPYAACDVLTELPRGVDLFKHRHDRRTWILSNKVALRESRIKGFYACGGIGLYIACIIEFVMGNTFPCVVFGTYGSSY
jgi:hypothetical protein